MQLADYLGLVTPYHSTRPKYMNMVAALLQPLVDAQAFLATLTADFDLDTAVGVQLDMVGQWIGRSRYLQLPLTGVYFTLYRNSAAVPVPPLRDGMDQGVWMGPYDPTAGIVAMPDDVYRKVLQLQAIANSWDGTLASIQAAFDRIFPGVVVQDKGDTSGGLMAMDVLIPGIEMSSLLLGVLEQDFPIKPSGVLLNIIESTVLTTAIFGFDLDATGSPIRGFDHGSWGIVIHTA